MKLPKFQQPNFTGSYTEWSSFIDLFGPPIDFNSPLTNSVKLYYLKACLKDDAAKLMTASMITDANYEIDQTLLPEYGNKRCIVQADLKKIWMQASMRSESGLRLRKKLGDIKRKFASPRWITWAHRRVGLLVSFLDYRETGQWVGKTMAISSSRDGSSEVAKHREVFWTQEVELSSLVILWKNPEANQST